MRRVLDFDPLASAARSVATIAPLGDDPLQSHDARLPEHHRAVQVLDMLAQTDAMVSVVEELHQGITATRPGVIAQIATI